VLLDNRRGLVRQVCVTRATGTAEVEAALLLIGAVARPGSTVGTDKGANTAAASATDGANDTRGTDGAGDTQGTVNTDKGEETARG